MTVSLFSCYLQGLKCSLVEIESHISRGLPSFNIVGLGDASIQESKERVRSALITSNFEFPTTHKTINLAPAHLKKQGSLFDLPIAMGILLDSGQITLQELPQTLIAGELSLDGSIKSVPGVLIIADFAKNKGFKKIILPQANLREASTIRGIEILGIRHLSELNNIKQLSRAADLPLLPPVKDIEWALDFSDIKGQQCAKRALTIAAAGRHHLLLQGPPGCGKTLLAQTLPSILPSLSFKEQIEISQIYSLRGLLQVNQPLIQKRPFRTVHHTASAISLIGGGPHPLPGEISLAHKGILFLDEIGEFPRYVLEVLRQPLESGTINISRIAATYTFPAAFQLVAAMNPCPCGFLHHPVKTCRCSDSQIENYHKKISGPLRDRIDICLQLQPVQNSHQQLEDSSSAQVKQKVEAAFLRQKARFKKEKITFNAELTPGLIKKYLFLKPGAGRIIDQSLNKLNISMREYHKILKLALTIADLEQAEQVDEVHLLEALSYRQY